jgi:hypothetical protein
MWWGDRFHSWGIVLMGGGSSLSRQIDLGASGRAATAILNSIYREYPAQS